LFLCEKYCDTVLLAISHVSIENSKFNLLIVDSVRELVDWVRNVVLMNVYLDLENPGGSGFWVGGYMSQGREMGKLVYEQPGNEMDGSCHSKEGSK
jgi:hypothetical protein